MDYQDFRMRYDNADTQGLEWVRQGSESIGADAQTFTGELFGDGGGGYGAPSMFDFNNDGNEVQDNVNLHDYNVDSVVDAAIKMALKQSEHMPDGSNDIMWAMGSDFNYQNALRWYK